MTTLSTPKKKPLGKGLSALLGPDINVDQENRLLTIEIISITLSKYQPRTFFSERELKDLASSIKEVGILQPLIVRQTGDDEYELIAGERRLRAAHLAGLTEVPVIVKDFDDKKSFEAALIENIQRADLTPIEEAAGYQQFINEYGYTQEELSQIIGKSRSYIANTLRLLNLPEKVRRYVHEGLISAGHARALLSSNNVESFANRIIEEKLNVRQAEAITRKDKKPGSSKPQDEDIVSLQTQLSYALQAPVQIKILGHTGTIEVKFHTLEDLDELITKISTLGETRKQESIAA